MKATALLHPLLREAMQGRGAVRRTGTHRWRLKEVKQGTGCLQADAAFVRSTAALRRMRCGLH